MGVDGLGATNYTRTLHSTLIQLLMRSVEVPGSHRALNGWLSTVIEQRPTKQHEDG